MITLIAIPALPKMETGELLKCISLTVVIDFVMLIACINF